MASSVESVCLTALAVVAVALHFRLTYHILNHPEFSASECSKAVVYLADLTSCMVAGLLTAGRSPASFTSSGVVHTVHGWATAFAGFRLSAHWSLHSINLFCYVVMQLPCAMHSESLSFLGCVTDSLKLVPFNAILPMLINMLHEARQRAKLLKLQNQVSL